MHNKTNNQKIFLLLKKKDKLKTCGKEQEYSGLLNL
jgi:hypothetical protein